MNLYHVSPKSNHLAIAKTGIEAAFAKNKSHTSWFVDWSRVGWALAHVSSRHKVPVDDLEIWIVIAEQVRNVKRSRLQGVFYTRCFVRTVAVISADRALNLWESAQEPPSGGQAK